MMSDSCLVLVLIGGWMGWAGCYKIVAVLLCIEKRVIVGFACKE